MRQSSIIVIDYLNLGLLSSLIKLKINDEVYVIFNNNNLIIESILLKFLSYKGIRVNFKKFNSEKTYYAQSILADQVAKSFVKNIRSARLGFELIQHIAHLGV